jgi:hypothetical protein
MASFVVETTATRLSAMDEAGHEICGAFLRQQRWSLYWDTAWFEPFGVPPIVEHLPIWTRGQALNLVNLFAMAWQAQAERDAA